MRTLAILCILGMLSPNLLLAGKYRQAAYLTNLYFANKLQQESGFVQPDKVFNKLKASDKDVGAFLVLNLVVEKGEHQLEVDILDRDGTLFDKLKFDPVLASQDDWVYTATGQFGGELPTGGIFFKIYDSHDGGAKEVIGTFRLMTAEW
ncbi:MAG: hypothetical protein OQK42_02715 [Sedimenticola sp.]|uniref:Uncharacterized protein n=1 Tax=Sedimenticola thiotaurini TaxID=1543721 RepID=A0A558CZJ3_9GAMM|nr:hypothetical protein [Sedimenticola sp.]MCW8947574.1 hypothetical protein [Sedimenticola sp.]MCW8975346.1 hypothetical protein [Sedimenticola sp.]MCW9021856.1 hypothetical protein [Sedimenticola sp.]TVT54143.1 MAG: hypothetical protein FHK82_10690 [Sedimenticola thiotaurini]